MQVSDQTENYELLEAEFERYSRLNATGHYPDAQLNSMRRTILSERVTLTALQGNLADNLAQLDHIDLELRQIEIEHADTVASLRERLSSLSMQSITTSIGETFSVSSPISGRVTGVQAQLGQRTTPNITQMFVIPTDSELIAVLLVPATAIGRIQAGQRVRLIYSAYSYERYGSFGGTIETISDTVFSPGELDAPVQPSMPVYRVRVALDRQTVEVDGRQIQLRHGLEVTAGIQIEENTLLGWGLKPFRRFIERNRRSADAV